ncbi:unnamed protein product [Boreogadus saida]
MARNRRLALALALADDEEKHVPRRLWLHDITRGRQKQGSYHNLVQELRFDDARFAAYFRLNKCQFEQLLRIVAPSITKLDTKFRQAISPEERLCICLWVGASTAAGIVNEWRVYWRVLGVSPAVAENIVKATCMLHNFLRWDGNPGLPGGASTEPSFGLQSAPRFGTNNATRDAVAVTEVLTALEDNLKTKSPPSDSLPQPLQPIMLTIELLT